MALGLNKILLANANTNTPGAYPQTVVISAIGIGNTSSMNAGTLAAQYVPAGLYIMPVTAGGNVAIEVNSGSNNNSWATYIASNSGGTVISDGYNVRANATVTNQSLTMYTVNGGQNVSATFTS
jgi:uncharacterized protein YigE (DUF2233 family)